jgi:hypothetical protein
MTRRSKGDRVKRRIVIAALALGLMLPAAAAGAVPQPVYFWGNVAAYIEAPGQPAELPAVRPSVISLTADGSVVVEQLQWTGWGSSVAHATGISSASNGIPNMAQGKRIKKPAEVTLSNPGLFQGREVYRCFALTVPPAVASPPSCLADQRGYWSLAGTPPKASTTPTQPTPSTYAHFYTPSRNISCEMSDNGTAQAGITCIMQRPQAEAGLNGLSGVATICQHQGLRCTGNLGYSPSLPRVRQLSYGSSVTVGRFRCTSGSTGVTCVVSATGKGFFISRQSVRPVG